MIDEASVDVVLFMGASAAELGSTHYALKSCSSCAEGNPLMREPAVLLASRAAAIAAESYACHRLRKAGHKRAAKVLRWTVVAIWLGFSAHNLRQARR